MNSRYDGMPEANEHPPRQFVGPKAYSIESTAGGKNGKKN